MAQFVDKSVSALRQGIHLLVVDLYPPSRRDPQGLHGEIWDAISGDFHPDDRNLTLAAYRARNSSPEASVEPVAVGVSLPNMPLFLSVDRYIETPSEMTYQMAFRGMPTPLKDVLEGRAPAESDG